MFFYFVVNGSDESPEVGLKVGNSASAFGHFIRSIKPVQVFPQELPLQTLLGSVNKRITFERTCVVIETEDRRLRISVDAVQPEALILAMAGGADWPPPR
jgi:hypothetical protein